MKVLILFFTLLTVTFATAKVKAISVKEIAERISSELKKEEKKEFREAFRFSTRMSSGRYNSPLKKKEEKEILIKLQETYTNLLHGGKPPKQLMAAMSQDQRKLILASLAKREQVVRVTSSLISQLKKLRKERGL